MNTHISDADSDCPVSLELLGALYRADPGLVAEMVASIPDHVRARLALFCYGRAHLRDVALLIAGACKPSDLIRTAGMTGQVLADQSRNPNSDFGRNTVRFGPTRAKVTLARTAA